MGFRKSLSEAEKRVREEDTLFDFETRQEPESLGEMAGQIVGVLEPEGSDSPPTSSTDLLCGLGIFG